LPRHLNFRILGVSPGCVAISSSLVSRFHTRSGDPRMLVYRPERHYTRRTGWLRAAVLGANDGIVSTASLLVGVASARATHADVLVAGVAGLVAGAMSMAAGESVSVSSQVAT